MIRVGAVARWVKVAGRTGRWWLVGVATVVGLLAVLWFSPVLAVRWIHIEGLSAVSQQQVRNALAIPSGQSLLRVDAATLARRVAAVPRVRSARVRRVFPATVQVTVIEREPVLYFDAPEGAHLVDSEGVEFAIDAPAPGLPRLVTDHASSSDPVTRAAVAVVAAVPLELRSEISEIAARSVSDIALTLRDGRVVVWGGAGDSQRKAAVVLPVLTRPGTVFDVSSPDLVTVR